MSPFIRLSTPAICTVCGKVIRAGRLALFSMSTMTCYACAKKRGEAEHDEEEDLLLKQMIDQEECH